jgi:hypothetical protein
MRYPFPRIAAVLITALAAPAAAQQPADSAAPAPPPPSLPAIHVVPARNDEFLRRALEDAEMHEREAEATLSRATEERAQTKARIEVKKRELETIDARIKLAEKEKDEAGKVALKADRRAGEAERRLAERLDAVYESEIELAKKSRDLARADQKAVELELDLAARRREMQRIARTDPAASRRTQQAVVALERKVLEARRDRAGVAQDVAAREQKIAERRLDLLKAELEASGISER